MEIGVWILLASFAAVPGNALSNKNLSHEIVSVEISSDHCMKQMDNKSKELDNLNQDWTLRCVYAFPKYEQIWEKWNYSYSF
jgi:hypothetical protein